MKATWVLRAVVASVLMLILLAAVALVDGMVDAMAKHWGWFPIPRAIEVLVFCVVTWRAIWDWASRRLWIGTRGQS